MPLLRLEQPTGNSGAWDGSAIEGQTNRYFIGVGTDSDTSTVDAPAFQGTPDGALIIHAVNFSEDNNNVANGGVAIVDRTTSVLTYTPAGSLQVGDVICYDVHGIDIKGWVGEYPDIASLPTNAEQNDIARAQNANYYQYDAGQSPPWVDIGGAPSNSAFITNIFSKIFFTITASGSAAGGGAGGGTNNGTLTVRGAVVDWALNTSVGAASQYQVAGTGQSTDIYFGGQAPVRLSTVDDPEQTASEFPFSSQPSTEASINTHGSLSRLADNATVQYNPTGNEAVGDSYVYNVVVVDGAGEIEYTFIRVRIVAASSGGSGGNTFGNVGGGTNTGAKSINQTTLSTFSTAAGTPGRRTGPFTLDMTPHLNNPNGTGTLNVTNLVNCVPSDFIIDNVANTIQYTGESGPDGSFDPVVV